MPWRHKAPYSFLTSVLDGGEWSASCLSCIASGLRTSLYPVNSVLEGPKNWPLWFGTEENLLPLLGIEPWIIGHQASDLCIIPHLTPISVSWFAILYHYVGFTWWYSIPAVETTVGWRALLWNIGAYFTTLHSFTS